MAAWYWGMRTEKRTEQDVQAHSLKTKYKYKSLYQYKTRASRTFKTYDINSPCLDFN